MKYDLLVKGGEILDPSQGLRDWQDVGIAHGRIAEVGPDLSPSEASKTVDVRGQTVVPGLIDLHMHVFARFTNLGLEADPVCSAGGVTTLLDVGSAGWVTFPAFRKHIVEPATVRIRCFLHICAIGLIYSPIGELLDIQYADPEGAARAVEENRDLILGIKVRLGKRIIGNNGLEPLRRAVHAARMAEVPVMVHIGGIDEPFREVIALLEKGDIITHCFCDRSSNILDEEGRLLPEVWEARRRGVLFDVGHGAGSFGFRVARAALDQGFPPDTISSDLHTHNINGPVYDLPTTMSKFLNLGVSLEEVIRMSTTVPSETIGCPELGTLRVGTPADLAVLKLEEGTFEFRDARRGTMTGTQKLRAVLTIKEGRVWFPDSETKGHH